MPQTVRPWLVLTGAGLVLRIILVLTASGYLYPGDHDDFVRWGLQAVKPGLLTLYTEPPARVLMRVYNAQQREWLTNERAVDRVCNYPPLSAYLLAISGHVYAWTWSPLTQDDWTRLGFFGPMPPGFGRTPIVNTLRSQIFFTFWSVVSDFILAAGVAAIVWRYLPRWAALTAYGLMLVAPPFWWDSIVWSQTDTLVLAPAVWMLYFMLRERWLVAGVLWGIAFGLKTQGILFTPIWGYALLMGLVRHWPADRMGAWRRPAVWGPVAGGVVALATIFVIALPFTLTSGMAWLERSYTENLFETYSEKTTLKAFNVWYLDLLISDSLDAGGKLLGIAKRTWGNILLLGGLAAMLVWTLRRWRGDGRGLVVWAAASMLLIVMLPTKVHERYLILSLPFIAAAIALTWRIWPGLVLLTIAMMGQLSWPMWLSSGRGQLNEIQANNTRRYEEAVSRMTAAQRAQVPTLEQYLADAREAYAVSRAIEGRVEWPLTLASLAGAGLAIAALASTRPRDSKR